MRITQVDIKNYRSIEEVNFKVLDPSITCLIGANGSGKSNILRAISTVKGKEKYTEEDFFVDIKANDSLQIAVTFSVEKEDSDLLEEFELSTADFTGFRVVRRQTVGGEPTREIKLIDYNSKHEKKLATNVSLLKKDLLAIELTDEEKEKYLIQIETVLDNKQPIVTRNGALNEVVEFIKSKTPETIEHDEPTIRKFLEFNPSEFAENNLLSKLSIELLSLENYEVLNEAPIEELRSRDSYPFLYDLLTLSGKNAEDFLEAEGNKRINVSEDASTQLTNNMSDVWPSHQLPLVIHKDKKDTSLSFCSRTPHDKAIPLESISAGTQWFLRFYTRFATARKESKRIIWLLDEPDRGLHAKSQHDLIELIENHSNESQILYCTHQPIMIQWHRLERINVVENIPKEKEEKYGKGTKIHRRFWDDSDFDSPLKEILKLFIGEDILWTKQHVIIEGPSDYFYLVGWRGYFHVKRPGTTIWDQSFSSPNRAFVPAGSIHNIPLFLYFLTKKNDLKTVNWASLTDTGKEHDDIQKVIKNSTRIEKFSNRVIPLKKPEGGTPKDGVDIEDLFERSEYFEEAKEYYQSEFPDCKFPSFDKLSTTKKITKALEEKLKELNPEFSERKLSLDKTGVAQHIYFKLATQNKQYSETAQKNFAATLHAIDKAFGLAPLK